MFYKGKSSGLEKCLSSLNLFFMGLANIIGPQIFIMLSGLITISGIYGIFSLIICFVLAILIALIFSELALSMPTTGLVVNSVNDAWGRFVSFLVGWSQLFGNITFAAVCALSFGVFINSPFIGAVVAVLVVTILELIGITEIGKIESILVIAIIGVLLSIIVFNFPLVRQLEPKLFVNIELNNIKKIFLGVGFFFLAFTGFEDVTTYLEEAKNIKKVPIVMIVIIIVISSLFILIYLPLLSYINSGTNLSRPLHVLSKELLKDKTNLVITLIGISATLSSLITALSTSSRNMFSLSERGFIPKKFFYLSSRKIPVYSIIASSFIVMLLLAIRKLDILVYLGNFLYFFIVIILCFTVIRLRHKREKLSRPFKIPFFPFLPLITAYLMLILMFFLDFKAIAFGLIWFFLGFILYILRIVGKKRLRIALLGANLVCSLLVILGSVLIGELYPHFKKNIYYVSYSFLFLFIVFGTGLIKDYFNKKGS
ncbi:amino acid permease [Candidatus Woesearchaeota archaeon]|nr:amino acid permease [Candidatus Woesearchaeota archaeon]